MLRGLGGVVDLLEVDFVHVLLADGRALAPGVRRRRVGGRCLDRRLRRGDFVRLLLGEDGGCGHGDRDG